MKSHAALGSITQLDLGLFSHQTRTSIYFNTSLYIYILFLPSFSRSLQYELDEAWRKCVCMCTCTWGRPLITCITWIKDSCFSDSIKCWCGSWRLWLHSPMLLFPPQMLMQVNEITLYIWVWVSKCVCIHTYLIALIECQCRLNSVTLRFNNATQLMTTH